MASVVSIQVTMDEKGVVTGVKNINSSLDQMGGGIQKVGQRGNVVFTELTKQQHEAHQAGLLLNNTLGIAMPRALENILAKLPGLGSLLATAFKASVVAALLGVVIDLIPKIGEAASEFGGFTKVMQEYNVEASKANQQLLVNPRNLSDARTNLAYINAQLHEKGRIVDSLEKEDGLSKLIFGYNKDIATKESEMVGLRQQMVDLTDDLTKKTEALKNQTIALFGQAGSAGLTGASAVRQSLVTELAKIDAQFQNVKPGSPEAELAENSRIIARLKANREIAAIDRQQADATRSLLNQSLQLDLHGQDLIFEKHRETIQEIDLLEKRGELGHTDAIQRRIAADAVEGDALVKLAYSKYDRITVADNAARDEGLKGIDAIVAAQTEAIDQIHTQLERGEIDVEEATKREVDANIKAHKQIVESARQMSITLRGFHDETVRSEEQAATASLPAWARANAQIIADEKDRIRQIDEAEKDLLHNVKANSDDFVRITKDAQSRREAVWHEMNAKLIDEHKRVVDQMAGQLESLFSGSISQNILNMLKKFLFKMLAEWLTHFSALQSGFGGLFSKLFGGGAGGGGFNLGSLFGLGGSSGGGSAAGAGSGVNQSFINSLGLSDSSSSGGASPSSGAGGMFGLGALGNLLGGALFMGIGTIFSSALGSILTPEPSKTQIEQSVLSGGDRNSGQIVQDYQSGKLLAGQAIDMLQQKAWLEVTELNFLGAGGQAALAAASFKANIDAINRMHNEKTVKGLQSGATQFHDGGFTGNAGFRLRSNEIKAVLRDDEFVVNPAATKLHRGTLERMNAGNYDDGGAHYHFHTLDALTIKTWLRSGGAKEILHGLSSYTREGGR